MPVLARGQHRLKTQDKRQSPRARGALVLKPCRRHRPLTVGYYNGWEEPFQVSFAETGLSHGAATLLQWDPTRTSVAQIAAGGFDSYLRSFARSVRDFGHPVVIGFGHEMNAYWYSWGNGQLPASTFVAAWRHIVTLFRDQGANDVTWLWTLQADEPGTGPIASWWPGAKYVTWVGMDGYYYRPSEPSSASSARPSPRCGCSRACRYCCPS